MKKSFSRPRRSPAADETGGATPVPTPKKVNKKDLLPDSDAQLADLAVYAAKHWPTEPWLTLRHSTPAAFETLAPVALSASDEDQRKLGWQSWFRLHDALERRTGLKTRPTEFRVSRPAAPPLS